ncbi:30S ribosomal protein S6--L-glutamate ligase [Aestuariivirga litoralis]|uniref:30S ribosomal protein S6--L-glutamate ligase n=1 Tax=Aestuariivirga litoralis TaxID=2650924 RepID=UPI0018C7FD50|nr:30S ribosomal protein S6--L-glutamate ligase [Aestuariivirga litoralis]MBG1232486.1 30S ribosomal protein S6--L-glutamate ligase [Aestuariivirga litoralis]
MKIGLLTRNPKLYSHQRIMETAVARGHEIVPIDYLRCYMSITQAKPELRYRGETLEGFDAVIPRIAASHTFYGLAVLRQFEMMGVYPLNESVAIGRSRDKLRCMQLLARDGVNLPATAFANDPQRTDEILNLVGGAPVVIKLLEGTQGIGVVLGETHNSAKSVIEAFHGADVNILIQQFIKEAEGKDVRVFVVGRKIVAAMERVGPKGEFRSNLHRGGSAAGTELSAEEKATALRATQSMGLNVAGVDLLRSKTGPVVMEVNSSPGLEGIEEATSKDVAKAIFEFLERSARPHKTQTRGKG